jgi:hypothetical protein
VAGSTVLAKTHPPRFLIILFPPQVAWRARWNRVQFKRSDASFIRDANLSTSKRFRINVNLVLRNQFLLSAFSTIWDPGGCLRPPDVPLLFRPLRHSAAPVRRRSGLGDACLTPLWRA